MAYKYRKIHLYSKLTSVKFNTKEKEFLARNEAARVATCHNNIPHVVPVSYIFENGLFYFATDYGTRKYSNLLKNDKIAISIDVYSSVGNKAVIVQGDCEIIERGSGFARLYKMFYDRFEWVKQDPWKEGEAPFIKVIPQKKVSWGF